MANNKHLFLRNEYSNNNSFKKGRNIGGTSNEQDEEEEVSKKPNVVQQRRLKRAYAAFEIAKQQRESNRTLQIPDKIDIVIIYFYKTFGSDLKKQFEIKYGLTVSYYKDFNKTVAFEISNTIHFKIFIKHLELFYESSLSETYEQKPYNLIALIHNFEFLSSNERNQSNDANELTISLISAQSLAGSKIRRRLLAFLEQTGKTIYQTDLSPDVFDVIDVSPQEIKMIVDNFDVVQLVTSARVARIRPGSYGELRRDYGFTVSGSDNLALVGVIDTGIERIEAIRPFIYPTSIDITEYGAPFWDEAGHGTAVASLIVLGSEFFGEVKTEYYAKARVAVIKVIHNDNDLINIVRIVEAIKEANQNYGIRLFNLSLNIPQPKRYNESISTYAYLLDKLSYERDLLIFISVGNIPEETLDELLNKEYHNDHAYPNLFYCLDGESEIHTCSTTNIYEPSESLNNISVGALAGNLEEGATSHITPGEELPAYYTRKFHHDYNQKINGTSFMRSQKNKHLNKPDLVFEGGDLFESLSRMEVLSSPNATEESNYFSRRCGTSLSTPLVTSMAAEISTAYPALRTQTIKALLINSAGSVAGANPHIFREFPKLYNKLIGFGRPNAHVLTQNGDNAVTFIIEEEIEIEEFRTIIISLPSYINGTQNKLNFNGTLCYSFLPLKDNHLSYLPLQITFGIFKPFDAITMSKMKTEDYKLNSSSWSDDFFGVDNRLFSNVQSIKFNLSSEKIEEQNNQVALAIKCTCKNSIPDEYKQHLQNIKHKFSITLTISELPTSRAQNQLYSQIIAINTTENIVNIEGTAEAEI